MSQADDRRDVALDKAGLRKALQDINAEIEYLQIHYLDTQERPDNQIRSLQQRAANIIRTLGESDLAKLKSIQDDAMSTAMVLLNNE